MKYFFKCISEIGEIFINVHGQRRIRDSLGFIYQKAYTQRNGNGYWRCQNYQMENFPCKAYMQAAVDGKILYSSGEHNHK